MSIGAIDPAQRRAARVVGFTYLLAMATSVFSEIVVRGRLLVLDDAAQTAHNILAHQRLFRLGITSEIVTFACTVVLLVSLYVILRPIDPYVALLAAGFRIIEAALCVGMTLTSFDVLRVLSGADYLRGFSPDQRQALARLSIGAHGAAFNLAFLFLGLGSALFAWLWLRSR